MESLTGVSFTKDRESLVPMKGNNKGRSKSRPLGDYLYFVWFTIQEVRFTIIYFIFSIRFYDSSKD